MHMVALPEGFQEQGMPAIEEWTKPRTCSRPKLSALEYQEEPYAHVQWYRSELIFIVNTVEKFVCLLCRMRPVARQP